MCDTYAVAKDISTYNLRDLEKDELIGERYTTLAQAIYPILRDYERAIEDARMGMKYGDDSTRDKKPCLFSLKYLKNLYEKDLRMIWPN